MYTIYTGKYVYNIHTQVNMYTIYTGKYVYNIHTLNTLDESFKINQS